MKTKKKPITYADFLLQSGDEEYKKVGRKIIAKKLKEQADSHMKITKHRGCDCPPSNRSSCSFCKMRMMDVVAHNNKIIIDRVLSITSK